MNKRETFGSRLGFVLVSAGCAIGLGNVWKFPYITGQYGGAAFILIYLLFLAILGLPILTCEFAVGRGSRLGIGGAFNALEPAGGKWHHYKWAGFAGNFLLMMFYTMVSGWMLYYAYRYITGDLMGLSPAEVGDAFGGMVSSPGTLTLWMFIALTVSCIVCLGGLQKGIEKITKVMMLILIVLMVALAVNSLFLEGAGDGIKFYLVPDFKRMVDAGIGNVVFAAMSQAFFTLSIGIGSMEIFGSYLNRDNTLVKEAATVVALDTFVALMAGFIVIPACFAFGATAETLEAGPNLLFISLPNVFNQMFGGGIGGRIVGFFFFVFMSFAALSTVIAVVENIIAFFMDQWNWSRKKATITVYILLLVLSMPAILGFNVLADVKPFGGSSGIMDLEDFLVSNTLLPMGSLLFVMFCTRKTGWGWENFRKEANEGKGIKIPGWIGLYMKYILPAIIIAVYLKGYYDYFYITPAKMDMGMKPVFAGLDAGGICWMVFAIVVMGLVMYISSAKGKSKK